jgi:hypothetical protein
MEVTKKVNVPIRIDYGKWGVENFLDSVRRIILDGHQIDLTFSIEGDARTGLVIKPDVRPLELGKMHEENLGGAISYAPTSGSAEYNRVWRKKRQADRKDVNDGSQD